MPYLGISVNFANIGIQNLEDAENRGQSQWKPNLTTMKKNFLLALLALTACLSCTAPKQENTAPAETQTEKALPSEFKPLATPLQKDKFIQINIVVGDIYRAAKAWAALLGVPEPEIWTNHLESNGEYPYTYRGQDDKPCDLQMCVIEMGNWVLELHEIDHNPSTFREFVNKHGQGVHHLGFEVGDARDEVIKELKGLGFDTERTIGIYPGSSWTIVDTEDVLGVNLNIKPKR